MTVNETLIVCKVLQENGYGDYVMTNQCSCDVLSEYANYIVDEDGVHEINMDCYRFEDHSDLPINKRIHEALAKYRNEVKLQ